MRFLDVPEGTDVVKIKKQISNMFSEARERAKPTKCVLCGREQTSFCNSHSVPKLALRTIADNGILLHASALMGFDDSIIDVESGVKKSGTFNYICRTCDSQFFQDYENEANLIKSPTDKMLAEIALKDMLLLMSKRAIEKELAKIQQKKHHNYENINELITLKTLDANEFMEEILFHKSIVEQNRTGEYQVLFCKILPYVIPIAAQSAIALPFDMEGCSINDVYNWNSNIRMQYMHLCFFPLKHQSLVLAFYHKRDKHYRSLRHQINSCSEDKVLRYLNYLLFAHTENYFISKSILAEIEHNPFLQKLSQEVNGLPDLGFLSIENNFGSGYTPINMDDIPNFLEETWAVV